MIISLLTNDRSFFTKPGSSSEDKTTPSKATDLSTQTRTPNEKENVGTSSDEKVRTHHSIHFGTTAIPNTSGDRNCR